MMMRMYALYEKSRRVLSFLVAYATICIAVGCVSSCFFMVVILSQPFAICHPVGYTHPGIREITTRANASTAIRM